MFCRSPSLLGLLLLACATPAAPLPPPPPAPPPPTPVAAIRQLGPGPITTGFGATLQVPAGFQAEVEGAILTLLEPDGVVELKLVELEGEDLAMAIAQAWPLLDPAFAWPAESVVEPPAKDGWDAIRVEGYAANAQGLVAQAVGRRLGDRIWVSLLRGPGPALEKRAAQLRSFLGSLEVPGQVHLDLAKATPTPLGDRRAELDRFVEAALAQNGTPGLAVAIIEGNQLSYAKGYGVRELGKPKKVDADTLMMIGSVSKSLTTLMMATAVDQGRFGWDTKVQEVLQTFQLGDPQLSAQLKVEELVCACTGLPRHDMPLVFEFEKKTPADVFEELAEMKPTTGLRETFQYQNHLVAAGGYLAAWALYPKLGMGPAYDRAMQERIFSPLGMKRTTLDLDRAMKDGNHALPHSTDLESTHHPVTIAHERFATYVRPSGGIWSSVNEMALYLIDELNKGALPNGQRIASEANLTHRWEQQVPIAADVYYGLGWMVFKTKGLRLISHGGATMGFAAQVFFLPEKGVGAVILANGTGGHAIESALKSKLLELWFGIDDKSQEQLDVGWEAQNKALVQLRAECKAPDEALMKGLLGTHHHPELGALKISKVKDDYVLDAGAFQTRLLRHDRKDGKVALVFRDPALAGGEMYVDPEGRLVLDFGQEHYQLERQGP